MRRSASNWRPVSANQILVTLSLKRYWNARRTQCSLPRNSPSELQRTIWVRRHLLFRKQQNFSLGTRSHISATACSAQTKILTRHKKSVKNKHCIRKWEIKPHKTDFPITIIHLHPIRNNMYNLLHGWHWQPPCLTILCFNPQQLSLFRYFISQQCHLLRLHSTNSRRMKY